MKNLSIVALVFLVLFSCKEKKTLPVFGKKVIQTENGQETISQSVPEFLFYDQKNEELTLHTIEDKIVVADFFFTSCPSICPIMTKNMLKLHDQFVDNDKLKFISFSIDPKRDTVAQLNTYAQKIGIESNEKWHFVTGERDDIYNMAAFFSILAYEDSTVPGGFEHNGYFVLIDNEQYIRGYYDGTQDEEIPKLIEDINILLDEK